MLRMTVRVWVYWVPNRNHWGCQTPTAHRTESGLGSSRPEPWLPLLEYHVEDHSLLPCYRLSSDYLGSFRCYFSLRRSHKVLPRVHPPIGSARVSSLSDPIEHEKRIEC